MSTSECGQHKMLCGCRCVDRGPNAPRSMVVEDDDIVYPLCSLGQMPPLGKSYLTTVSVTRQLSTFRSA